MIELKHVTKTYKSKKSTDTNALRDISLSFGNKGLIFIVGSSGSGKSTLLNCIGGLDKIDSGSIIINDIDISKKKEIELDEYRNSYVGFVFQDYNLLEDLNIKDNIKLASNLQNKDISDKEFDELLHKVNLDGLNNRRINELSGGQKQRVAIARALIKNPHVILADEPTGNLDSKTSKQIIELLKELSRDRLVIVVSHDIRLAEEYGDRSIEIEDGLVKSDTGENNSSEIESVLLEKSHLPFNISFKLAVSNLFSNKIRFILTILLTCLSLLFVLVTWNVYNYNENNEKELISQMMIKNKEYDLDILKNKCVYNFGEIYCNRVPLFQDEVDTIKKDVSIPGNVMYELYTNSEMINFNYNISKEDFPKLPPFKNTYYLDNRGLIFVELNDNQQINEIIGNLPTYENEITITKWIAEKIIKYGVEKYDGTFYKPESFDDILQDHMAIKLGNDAVYITGITLENDEMYEPYKNESVGFSDEIRNFQNNYDYNIRQTSYIYVRGLTNYLSLVNNQELILNNINLESVLVSAYGEKKLLTKEIEYLDATGKKKISHLANDEIILSKRALENSIPNFNSSFIEYQKEHPNQTYEESMNEFLLLKVKSINAQKINATSYYNLKDRSDYKIMKIVGYSFDDYNYLGENIIDEYESPEKTIVGIYHYLNEASQIKQVLKNYRLFNQANATPGISFNSFYRYSNYNANNSYMYVAVRKYAFWIMAVFIIFATILIYNFLKNTIDNNKKTIGILRALGSKNNDILSIYIIETIIVILISWLLSCAAFFLIVEFFNNHIFTELFFITRFITADIKTIGYVLEYYLIISLCIIILTTSRLSRIKPVDAINNRK